MDWGLFFTVFAAILAAKLVGAFFSANFIDADSDQMAAHAVGELKEVVEYKLGEIDGLSRNLREIQLLLEKLVLR